MLLRHLKEGMLLPEKEVFINREVNIRGVNVYLVSITLEASKITLWTMNQVPCIDEEMAALHQRMESISRRDEMINHINNRRNSFHIFISELMLQGSKLKFSSSTASYISNMDYNGYMKLQHFVENGLDTAKWEDVDVSNIVITGYQQDGSEGFCDIDWSKDLDIELKLNKECKQVLINKPLQLQFGQMQKGSKLNFYDSIEGKERGFYINKLEHFDIWEDFNNRDFGEHIKSLPEDKQNEIKKQHIASLERICPKGMDLAVLEYETEDNIQLEFYSKAFLDEIPVRKAGSASAVGMIFRSDRELGDNGYKSRTCMIAPVEKDFYGSIDVELFAWYREIPEQIIKLED